MFGTQEEDPVHLHQRKSILIIASAHFGVPAMIEAAQRLYDSSLKDGKLPLALALRRSMNLDHESVQHMRELERRFIVAGTFDEVAFAIANRSTHELEYFEQLVVEARTPHWFNYLTPSDAPQHPQALCA